jgi:hypothetical protein
MKLTKPIVLGGIAAIAVVIVAAAVIFLNTSKQSFLTSNPKIIMKKVNSYEVHLAVSPAGKPVTGYLIFQLEGEAAPRQFNNLQLPEVTVISSLLSGGNIYFDLGLNEFVKKN